MKVRNFFKRAAVVLMGVVCAVSIAACSGDSGKGGDVAATYMTSSATYLDAIAWYSNSDTMLVTRDDGTYELYFKQDIFGTTDPGMKGEKTIIYFGTYTSEASADGDASHLDLALSAPTRIYFEQHGKAFGREPISINVMLDTANWTDNMTTVAFPEGSEDGAADFLTKYGQEISMTVEDPSLYPEDTALSYRIVTMSVDSLDITGA